MSTPTISRLDMDDRAIITDTDVDATVEKDVMAGPCRVLSLRMTGNATENNYLKLFDDENPTLGTSVPDFVFPLIVSANPKSLTFDPPLVFETGLSIAAVQEPGTGGTTPPTSVTLALVLQEGVE